MPGRPLESANAQQELRDARVESVYIANAVSNDFMF